MINNEAMWQHVYDAPNQLRWALDVSVGATDDVDHIVLVGMGGSAMAADVAIVGVADTIVGLHVHRGYGLPSWVTANNALVVACSYSGNTAETLSAVDEALERGVPVVTVSAGGTLAAIQSGSVIDHVAVPDGLQPRAALGYQVSAISAVLGAVGVNNEWRSHLDEAATVAERLLQNGEGVAVSLGSDLAEACKDRVPLVMGGDRLGSTAARRWAAQLNENAKRLSFVVDIPEANHNLLEPLVTGSGPSPFGVIALIDPAGDPRIQQRIELTMRLIGDQVQSIGEVTAQGDRPLSRLLSLIVVGDVASVALADLGGVSATPVETLEDFKQTLTQLRGVAT